MNLKKRILLAGAAVALTADATWALAQQAGPPTAQPAPTTPQGATTSATPGVTADQNPLGDTTAYSNFKRDRNVSVRQRPHPGYEAVGLREGAFMVWPKLTASAETSNNIFSTVTNQKSDTIWHVAPEVDASSNWARNALQAYARAITNTYSQTSGQNTYDYSVGAQGRIDVLRTAQINAGADWSHLTEPRTSIPSIGLEHPTQYEQTSAYLSGAREFNRLRISGRLDTRDMIYLNRLGNPPQHDRDHSVTDYIGRVDYAVSPDTALFVELTGNTHDYRVKTDPGHVYPNFHDRSSDGVQALVGANFELSALSRGEIGVGYIKSSFKDPAFRDISGFGARGQVEWFPSQLTTVSFTGSRTIEDSPIGGSSGFLSTNVGAQVDHELLRNVIVTGQASYGNDLYKVIDRHDKRITAGLSATYLLNRSVGVTVGYNYYKLNSSGKAGNGEFDVNKVSATVTLQY